MTRDDENQQNSELGDKLRAAQKADLTWYPISDQAQEVSEEILRKTEDYALRHDLRKRKIRSSSRASYVAAIATWLADLVRHSANGNSDGFLYQASEGKHFVDTFMGDRQFRFIADVWPKMGLMEISSHFDQVDDFEGTGITLKRWAARYCASADLLSLAENYSVNPETLHKHFQKEDSTSQLVRIKERSKRKGRGRKDQGREITPEHDESFKEQVKIVQQLNHFMSQHEFSGIPFPELQRIFNNGDDPDFAYDKGGRFYSIGPGSYQSLSDRSQILIDGSPTVEIDIRASHLSIAYGVLGESLDASNDPYNLSGLPRSVAKHAVVLILNDGKIPAKWPRRAIEEITKSTGERPPVSAPRASEMVLNKHSILRRLSETALDWSKLQFMESEVLRISMERLRDHHDVPALPVHDSLIVPVGAAKETERTLKAVFLDVCGADIETAVQA